MHMSGSFHVITGREPFAGVVFVAVAGLFLAASGCAADPAYRVTFPVAANASTPPRVPGAVLMVLSAAPRQTLADGSTRATGYFLNEFYEPYRTLVDAGHTVAIATPNGRPAALDPESLDPKYWRDHPEALAAAQQLVESLPNMRTPLALSDVLARAEDYQGIVVPGGQGVMVDLLDDPVVHALLLTFGTSDRPVGLICHAPAILTRLPPASNNVFRGRRVAAVSGIEEWYIETFVMGAKARVRRIGRALDDGGYRHEASFPGRSGAVRDCNLVTSQNPFSGEAFGRLYLEALTDWRRGGQCIAARDDPR